MSLVIVIVVDLLMRLDTTLKLQLPVLRYSKSHKNAFLFEHVKPYLLIISQFIFAPLHFNIERMISLAPYRQMQVWNSSLSSKGVQMD